MLAEIFCRLQFSHMGTSRCENFTLGQNRFGGRFLAVLHCYYYPVFGCHFLINILLFICGYFSELENGARGLRTWAQNVGSERGLRTWAQNS